MMTIQLPTMGWVSETSSPVQSLSALATRLGLAGLWVKRDDCIDAFGGGNKVRKLDYLLASDNYQNASHWHVCGAMGSGQLLVATRIARRLGKHVIAHVIDEPVSERSLQTYERMRASAGTVLRYRSRLSMLMRHPELIGLNRWRGQAIIPPGATSPTGNVGYVRAGIELATQIRIGDLPCPDRIYIALGSGGTATGLALGLALSGVTVPVHAISVVEPIFVCRPRMASLMRSQIRCLRRLNIEIPRELTPRLVVDTSEIGAGYAQPTMASVDACQQPELMHLQLESTYSGKAMAALLRDAWTLPKKSLLFWHTCTRLDWQS